MRFSLKRKLKRVGSAILAGVMAVSLVVSLPAGMAKADEGNNFKVWLDDLATEGVIEPGTTEYGAAGSVTLVGNGTTKFTQEYSAAVGVERDGKVVNGYKAGKRHATANDIPSIPKAGDGCAVVFAAKLTGMFKIYFQSTSFVRVWKFDTATGERDTTQAYVDSPVAADSFSFKAEAGKTYVMSTTGKTNNMAYIGYQFVEDVTVTAPVEQKNVDAAESALEGLEVYFTDSDLGGAPVATLKKGDTSAALMKGHTYTVSCNDGGVRTLVDGKDTFVCTGDKVTVSLYNIPDVTLKGNITGAAEGTVTGLKFTNMVNGTVCDAVITGTSYTCTMKPGEYDASVVTTNGGFTKDRASVKETGENVNDVWVEMPSTYGTFAPDAIAKFPATGSVSSRGNDFTAKPGATVTIPVSGPSTVTVKAYYDAEFTLGDKACSVTSGSTSQIDEFTIDASSDVVITFGGDATSYLTEISVVANVPYKNTINVPGDYDTMKEAITAIKGMNARPAGEEGRITINLTKDLFEQVVVDVPYVTLNGNNHTISWYYGVGTFYYSVDPSTGLYNERLANDRYSSAEGNGNLWGGVFIVRGDNFIAKDTTFKNTYNYELTEAEKTDIAKSALSVDRLAEGADVAAYAYKERSNAFYIEAKNIECYNCKILSSQDTLGRNGSSNNGYSAYFRDCVIGGNTDYICGEFAAVFDDCELQWKTFKDDEKNNGKVGYIVAPKTNAYVFRDCVVTTDGVGTGVKGYYGRTWGNNSNCSFIRTQTNGYIIESGWAEMSTGEGKTAIFKEYANVNGSAALVTSGAFCGADNQTVEAVKDYLENGTVSATDSVYGGWVPTEYKYTKGVDYTNLNSAIDAYNLINLEGFKDVTALKAAIEAANDLSTADQAKVDAMAQAIIDAILALEKDTGDDKIEADSADVSINTPDATDKVELTDDEKAAVEAGGSVSLVVEATNIATSVSAEDKALVEAALTGKVADATIGTYLDIDVYKVVGGVRTAVTSTTAPLTVSVALTSDLISTTNERTYWVVRIHEGVATVIDATYNSANKTVSFDTDKFSTYAVLYKDGAVLPEGGPSTGDSTPIGAYAGLAFGSVIVLAALFMYEKKRTFVK